MANDNVNVSGVQYQFGLKSADAPSGISNFTARTVATLDMEPEVFVTATNGEGHVEAIAISKPANHKISCSFGGYITDGFTAAGAYGSTVSFMSRKFFIKKVSAPRQKGAFVEVSIDVESYPLITG